ncbi:hypothetical protein AVEN_165764-1 [Araneus ventricosus]|uniref:Uncharacterized protein n=1 Tax=Araneus ventricosus TaxID=182803 RepID=A0A4Y2TMC6_ARAVE|nr:hypothetical protein AVEN_167001-1 [Araneus ventricosus]GBO00889.1 hypothetical protein AVEN_64090-1 [Araneus ventricosus]GBO00891.1 hypothetical protein AVEN_165764-1 [Araneus ventricosus]
MPIHSVAIAASTVNLPQIASSEAVYFLRSGGNEHKESQERECCPTFSGPEAGGEGEKSEPPSASPLAALEHPIGGERDLPETAIEILSEGRSKTLQVDSPPLAYSLWDLWLCGVPRPFPPDSTLFLTLEVCD